MLYCCILGFSRGGQGRKGIYFVVHWQKKIQNLLCLKQNNLTCKLSIKNEWYICALKLDSYFCVKELLLSNRSYVHGFLGYAVAYCEDHMYILKTEVTYWGPRDLQN